MNKYLILFGAGVFLFSNSCMGASVAASGGAASEIVDKATVPDKRVAAGSMPDTPPRSAVETSGPGEGAEDSDRLSVCDLTSSKVSDRPMASTTLPSLGLRLEEHGGIQGLEAYAQVGKNFMPLVYNAPPVLWSPEIMSKYPTIHSGFHFRTPRDEISFYIDSKDFDTASRISAITKDTFSSCLVLLQKSYFLPFRKDIPEMLLRQASIGHWESYEKPYDKRTYTQMMAKARIFIGVHESKSGAIDKARDYFIRAIRNAKELKDRVLFREALEGLKRIT